MKVLISILSVNFVCSVFFMQNILHAKPQYCGKLAKVKGRVEVLQLKVAKTKGDEGIREMRFGEKKMKLSCDDIVVTGRASRAKVKLKNNATLTIGPNSRLEILREITKRGGVNLLKLTYGKVRALFKEKNKKKTGVKGAGKSESKFSRFIIKTPTVVAGVRGTDFYLSYEPNSGDSTQATIEGLVEVRQVATGQKVLVKGGQEVAVKKVAPAPPVTSDGGIQKKPAPIALIVQPIRSEVIQAIRQTSAIVKRDKEFTSKKAIALLGKPAVWLPPPDEIPYDLKDIKNEF